MGCELILVLDASSPREVTATLGKLRDTVRWVKIGLEMYTACGPACVEEIAALGFQVFLDLKLHDIPNTVAGAVASAARLPIRLLTLHTSGGAEMMARAVEAQKKSAPELRLLGVTVLTSLGAADLPAVGVAASPEEQVVRLARLAEAAGLGGLVCSPLELPRVRAAVGPAMRLVTPGIRPRGAAPDDQARVLTPAEAAAAGANFIVVGRPIFQAADPVAAARAIQQEIAG